MAVGESWLPSMLEQVGFEFLTFYLKYILSYTKTKVDITDRAEIRVIPLYNE